MLQLSLALCVLAVGATGGVAAAPTAATGETTATTTNPNCDGLSNVGGPHVGTGLENQCEAAFDTVQTTDATSVTIEGPSGDTVGVVTTDPTNNDACQSVECFRDCVRRALFDFTPKPCELIVTDKP